jgi:hypothetical protein
MNLKNVKRYTIAKDVKILPGLLESTKDKLKHLERVI